MKALKRIAYKKFLMKTKHRILYIHAILYKDKTKNNHQSAEFYLLFRDLACQSEAEILAVPKPGKTVTPLWTTFEFPAAGYRWRTRF